MANKKTQKEKHKLNMSRKMLLVTVLPLLILAVVVALVSYRVFFNVMKEQAKSDMTSQAALVQSMYDSIYPGDFSVETRLDSYYTLYKGGYDITGSTGTIDNIKDAYGDEITIFRGATSVLTTLRDASGSRQNLQNVSVVVEREVYEAGEAKFYSDVRLNEESYFAYFTPLVNSDGSIFGMIGIYRLSSDINRKVRGGLFPVLFIYLLATILIGFISVQYSSGIVRRIKGIQRFINRISQGKFDQDISDKFLKGDDELSDLARSGKVMRQELSLLVEYDALTELYNRRYAIGQLHRFAETGVRDYCMCIGDIDFFKKVNDTYGHDAGDEVLKHVSRQLKEHMLGKGFVARWGGEEFLIVFQHLSLKESVDLLLKTLEDIRAMVVMCGGNQIKVTMSFGITEAGMDQDYDTLIKEADERLYYSKTHGRNQITSIHVTEANNALEALDRR